MTVTNLTSIGTLGAEFTVTEGVIGVASATTSVKGLMSAADKTKLDGLSSTGLSIPYYFFGFK